MKRTKMACLAILAFGWQVGCASVAKRTERTDRRVLRSEPAELHPKGPLTEKGTRVTEDRLTTHVERVRLCRSATLEHVSYQRVEERTTTNDVFSIVAGTAMLATGGYLLATRNQFSDETKLDEKGEEQASDREFATVCGVIGLLAGSIVAIQGAMIAAESGDHDLPNPRRESEHVKAGVSHGCGVEPVESGSLQVRAGDTVLKEMTVGNTVDSFDLRQKLGEVCLDETVSQQPLELVFAVEGSTPLHLTTWNGAACHDAMVARSALRQAETRLAGKERLAIRLGAVAGVLERAHAAIEALPATDRDRPALTTEEKRVAGLLGTQAADALDGVIDAFRSTLPAGPPENVVAAARPCFQLATLIPARQGRTWSEVYGALVAADVTTVVAVGTIDLLWKSGDVPTGRCAMDGVECPPHTDQTAVRAHLAPLAGRIRAQLDAQRQALDKAAKALSAKVTEPNGAHVRSEVANAAALAPLCVRRWDEGLEAACSALDVSREAAARLMDAKEPALVVLRSNRTANAWRAIFPRCRQLAAFVDQLRSQGHCDAGCMRARNLAQADLDRLTSFSVPDGAMTPDTNRDVRNACREARCPNCP